MTDLTPASLAALTLDEAWRELERVLPKGWCISIVPAGHWPAHATAWNHQVGSREVLDGFGPTPATALLALALTIQRARPAHSSTLSATYE